MTAKRPSGEPSEEVPLEKRERLEDTNKDVFDAELDDEVEKELREFERLQTGLLGTELEQENGKAGGENRSHIVERGSKVQEQGKTGVKKGIHLVEKEYMQQDDASGSDMELDDLEQEIAEARRKSSRAEQQIVRKVPNKSKQLVLDETVSMEDIRVLPDTFAEENLRGDDLVEESGIPEDGEEACLDMERVRLFKDSKAVDPLLTPDPQPTHQNFTKENCVKSQNQDSRSEPEQAEVERSLPDVWSAAQEILRSECQLPEYEDTDDPNDPDFPSPGKRKSRSRAQTNRSKLGHSQQCQFPPKKQRADKEFLSTRSPERASKNQLQDSDNEKRMEPPLPPLTRIRSQPSPPSKQQPTQQLGKILPQTLKSSVTKDTFQDPVLQRPGQTTARLESDKIYSSLPGTSQIGNDSFYAAPFVPKEAFVDPVLNIPVQPESLYKDPEFRDPIFDHVSEPTAQQIERASPEIIRSREDDRVIRVEQPGEKKIPEKTAALRQHHVRAINFDQAEIQPNSIVQHTSPILSKNYEPEVVKSPLPRPKSPVRVSPDQKEPRITATPPPNSPKPPKHPEYMDFLRNPKNSANPAPRSEQQDRKERASSPGNPSDDAQPTKVTIDITYDKPAEYCVVERVVQRRFESNFLLDNEKSDMIRADRPEIWCPELYPYLTFYENQTWLVACNELRRFFCWPCLFFASKVIWSVACEENSENMIGREINKHKQSPVHQESVKQLDAFTSIKKPSIIHNLLSNDFVDGTWTDQNKEAIIMKGRPRPILDNGTDKESKPAQTLAFEEVYDEVKWLCGCTYSKKFYCWPCLLFRKEKWTCSGTIKSVEATVSHHETDQLHMNACLKLGKWEFDLRTKSEARREEIEKTRGFLKCLVEILCAEKKKINNAEFSPMDLVDSLELMSKYNEKLRTFMDEKSENSSISQIVPLYTTAILDSIEFFIKRSILEEIKTSNFVSLIFDHSSGLSNKAILSVIARYVDGNGQVHERFVKLLNVGYNTPSNMLFDEFFQIITELQCRSTLVGFTYDGYMVKPGNIPDFNAKVQKLCPNAKFFHYTEHNIKRVLKQTLSHVPICRRVLQAVKELAGFFESTPSARKSLLYIVAAADKSQCEEVWRSPNFIKSVFIYHAVIVEMMESICKNAQDWKIKTVVQASNFLDFFKDSTNRFYVTVMARIFDAFEDLSKELDQEVEIENLKMIASHTALKIQKLGRNFDNLVESACSHLEVSAQENPRKEMTNLREQFSNVIRLVVKLVKNRIFGLESGYCKMSTEMPTSSFTHFIKLKRHVLRNVAFPSNFSSTKLSKELQFFRSASIFSDLDISEIIAHMTNYNMTQVLPEFFKFLQLALTVPKKQLDDPTIPAVHRISAFIEGKKDMTSTDALIWMEKELLSNLQKEPDFYKKVADRVVSITKKDSLVQSTNLI